MRIFILSNSDLLALPTIALVEQMGLLVGVGYPLKTKNEVQPALSNSKLNSDQIHWLDESTWSVDLKSILIEKGIDTVWVLTFPWKIPRGLLEIPKKGFVNFHFGLLPKYKGADPIFWQIKNGEAEGGVTIHLMNEQLDEGPVLMQEKIPIQQGETYGSHCQQLGHFAATTVQELLDIQKGENQKFLQLTPTNEVLDQRPIESDFWINWESQSAKEIECLVNACNPKYGGGRTIIEGFEVRLIEVVPVTMEEPVTAEAGQIVHSDAIYGPIVKSVDGQFIRITVAQMAHGYLSGTKLALIGFSQGRSFG